MRITAAIALLCVFFLTPAEARRHRPPAPDCGFFCGLSFSAPPAQSGRAAVHQFAPAAQIVGHPGGCPRTAFCGCGAAVHVFGSPVRRLWLAANWFSFPRAHPASGMVAVRRHHVFVLESHVNGDRWLAYDANSGGHRTRMHVRSIAGYTIVNPHPS